MLVVFLLGAAIRALLPDSDDDDDGDDGAAADVPDGEVESDATDDAAGCDEPVTRAFSGHAG